MCEFFFSCLVFCLSGCFFSSVRKEPSSVSDMFGDLDDSLFEVTSDGFNDTQDRHEGEGVVTGTSDINTS